VGVGEVVVGDPKVAVDTPKEDYRVRSTDYGARPKAARGQGELEYGWLGEEKTAMTGEALAAVWGRREGLVAKTPSKGANRPEACAKVQR